MTTTDEVTAREIDKIVDGRCFSPHQAGPIKAEIAALLAAVRRETQRETVEKCCKAVCVCCKHNSGDKWFHSEECSDIRAAFPPDAKPDAKPEDKGDARPTLEDYEKAVAEHNAKMDAVPTLAERPKTAAEGLRFLAKWFEAMYRGENVDGAVEADLRRWANEWETNSDARKRFDAAAVELAKLFEGDTYANGAIKSARELGIEVPG